MRPRTIEFFRERIGTEHRLQQQNSLRPVQLANCSRRSGLRVRVVSWVNQRGQHAGSFFHDAEEAAGEAGQRDEVRQ